MSMEENKKLGLEPAFPLKYTMKDINVNGVYYQEYEFANQGMSKRFYAACAAMQGLLSSWHTDISFSNMAECKESAVKAAYEFADELLKQENL